jgi:hypothetical protein
MMKARATPNASVDKTSNGWILRIPKGDSRGYRLAQLDDYSHLSRHEFPHHSLDLSLRARTSAESASGTWGFGVWNDPFGLSLGFGGSPFRLPTLPNAAWFFYASPQNYLSFQDDKPAQGFLAQTFRRGEVLSSLGGITPPLLYAGLALPFSPQTTRQMLGRVIAEDGVAVSVDVTQWHGYKLRWSPTRVVFEVDDAVVLETSVSPRPPLGIVIWIDNQFAAFTPEGRISFGVLENPEAWLEIEDIVMRHA